MMERLMARAEAIARAAQSRRLAQIAETLGERGMAFELDEDSVAVRGRGLVQRWLADPLFRFVSGSLA